MKNIIIKLINFLANTILLLIIALVAELLAINNLIQAQRGYYDDWSQLKDCNRPLGLIDGRIHDWQLSDSSSNNHHQKDPNCNTRYARIHQWPGRGWCPNPNSTYNYLQIDLGYETAINGLVTQGRADGKSWIRSYRLMFSTDANQWHYYNQKQTVLANRDSHSLQYYLLADLQVTRFVRLEVLTWHSNYPGLRVELLGCRRCDTVINYPPRTVYKASSSRTWPQDAYCAPENAYIDGSVGWCAKWNNQNQWLAVDLGPPTKIVGVVTRGTGAPFRRHWQRQEI
ncbi:neuropilin-2-like [Oppia nitens]|uniref:neuropilin-2-like n=1 Tax=Oppia nitens TaxID=1686743 RepID=UPI0023DAC1E0|nr:neuropilin-2-like [Oppia nitens]